MHFSWAISLSHDPPDAPSNHAIYPSFARDDHDESWDRFTSFCIEHHGFCYREDVNRPQILDTMHTMWILQETSYHLGAMMMSVLHQVLDFYGVIMGTTDIFVWGQGLRSPLNTVHSMIAQASGRLQGSLWCLLEALHCVVAFSSMVKVWEESLLGLKENCLID